MAGQIPSMLALAALCVVSAACQITNPAFCCESDATCASAGFDEVTHCAEAEICDERGDFGSRNTCVARQCDATQACADTATPVCDDGRCRGCSADAECASEVCNEPTGRCVETAAVIYLSVAGTDGGGCLASAPCATLGYAQQLVTSQRPVIRMRPGSYTESVVIAARTVEIAGDDAVLTSAGAEPALRITEGATVAISGLTLDAATATLVCDGMDGPPAVTLREATLHSGTAAAIDASICGVTLDRTSLIDGFLAISATDADIVVSRSLVRGNTGGGLDLVRGSFAITNTVIADNGSSSSGLGGVRITSVPGTADRILAFDTITGNVVSGSGPAGVACFSMPMPPVFVSNIVHGNDGVDASTDECTWRASDIGGEPAGVGNVDVDPDYADAEYHLAATSPLIDRAEAVAGIAVDRDGDPRPQGAAPDVGADERVP